MDAVILKAVRPRSPQEKKELTYRKDRRNVYGESPYGARKSIPLRKAQANRENRRAQEQCLPSLPLAIDEEMGDEIVSKIEAQPPVVWKKMPDAPLGEVLKRKMDRRKSQSGPKQTFTSPTISLGELFEKLFDRVD